MNFDRMQHAAARQQLRLLGGVECCIYAGNSIIDPALILIQKNIEVVTDNGMRSERRTVGSLLVAEANKISRGAKITAASETYEVSELLDNDGYVLRVFLRG